MTYTTIKPDVVKFYDKVAEAFKAPSVRKRSSREEELENYAG